MCMFYKSWRGSNFELRISAQLFKLDSPFRANLKEKGGYSNYRLNQNKPSRS